MFTLKAFQGFACISTIFCFSPAVVCADKVVESTKLRIINVRLPLRHFCHKSLTSLLQKIVDLVTQFLQNIASQIEAFFLTQFVIHLDCFVNIFRSIEMCYRISCKISANYKHYIASKYTNVCVPPHRQHVDNAALCKSSLPALSKPSKTKAYKRLHKFEKIKARKYTLAKILCSPRPAIQYANPLANYINDRQICIGI